MTCKILELLTKFLFVFEAPRSNYQLGLITIGQGNRELMLVRRINDDLCE